MSSGDQSLPPPKWMGHFLPGFLKVSLEGLRQMPIFKSPPNLTKTSRKEPRVATCPRFCDQIRSICELFQSTVPKRIRFWDVLFNALICMWWKSSFPASLTLTLQLVKLLLIKFNAAPGKTMQFFLVVIKARSFSVSFPTSLSYNLWLDNTLSRVGWAPSIQSQWTEGSSTWEDLSFSSHLSDAYFPSISRQVIN